MLTTPLLVSFGSGCSSPPRVTKAADTTYACEIGYSEGLVCIRLCLGQSSHPPFQIGQHEERERQR
jgi:hypothetical protein